MRLSAKGPRPIHQESATFDDSGVGVGIGGDDGRCSCHRRYRRSCSLQRHLAAVGKCEACICNAGRNLGSLTRRLPLQSKSSPSKLPYMCILRVWTRL